MNLLLSLFLDVSFTRSEVTFGEQKVRKSCKKKPSTKSPQFQTCLSIYLFLSLFTTRLFYSLKQESNNYNVL